MHNILRLKKAFQSKKNSPGFGTLSLPVGSNVSGNHIHRLREQLEAILAYWQGDTRIGGALVSVHYRSIVAKSNRIQKLLGNIHSPEESVRGARFEYTEDRSKRCHVFTHFVALEELEESIRLLEAVEEIVWTRYRGSITDQDMGHVPEDGWNIRGTKIYKTSFQRMIRDAYYVERFDIDRQRKDIHEASIVTIYRTNVDTKKLLSSLGIDIYDDRIVNQTMLRLTPAEMQRLQERASYLISMSVTDFNKISLDDIGVPAGVVDRLVPPPQNEPIIGVIDTPFDDTVYFHEWVDSRLMLDPDIVVHSEDYIHGTAVSSIIVDGPKGNPSLEDGCGRFRVRHFGVATKQGFSAFTLLKQLEGILAENTDIRVWNLSLGSNLEIDDNFISPVAAELDRLQNQYDVIFVIAGTNRPADSEKADMRIGSPADSLNAVVVNSVNKDKESASYTRVGPVLSFFHKPDVSYYGGDGSRSSDRICVCCDNMGAMYKAGTSFAAPWIARKLAYLIYIMGMNREVAKALLIDSAAGWNGTISDRTGFGIVPIHIRDIIQTKEDEIRFFVTGTTDEYETYDYSLPIPVVKGKHPFFARATLTYFPSCNRDQGVDYTCTEMDFKFGRVRKDQDGKIVISDIKNNRQAEDGFVTIYEQEARSMYRKWDNVKYLSERISARSRERKAYGAGMWGIDIKTKERTNMRKGAGLTFGIVVTLKEMHQMDRYDDFFKLCQSHGWFVQAVDAQVNTEIYAKQEEEIHLE